GGTIQIMTREARPSGWHGEWNLGAASADLSLVSDGQVSWSGARWWWLGGLSGRKHNDLRAGGGRDSRSMFRRFLGVEAPNGRLQDTGFTQSGFHTKVGARLTPTQLFSAWYQRSEQGDARNYKDLEGGLGRLQSGLTPQVLDFGYARYEKLALGRIDSLTGTVSWNRQLDGTVRQGFRFTDPVITDRNEVRVLGATLTGTSHVGQRQAFAFGGELYRELISSERFDPRPARPLYPNGSRYRTAGAFLQDRIELIPNRLRATLGGRWTQVRFGGRDYGDFTYSTNLRWQVASALALHGSVGRGFRAPNVNDLGGIGLNDLGYEIPAAEAAQAGALLGANASEGATSLGRALAELKAERLFNYEFGVQSQVRRVEIRAQLFNAELRDPIVRRTVLFPAASAPSALAGLPVRVIPPTAAQLAQGVVTVATAFDPRAVKAFVNDGASRYYGLETSLRARLASAWTIEGNYSYILGRDLNPNRNIRRLPPQQGFAALTRARGRYWWRVSTMFAGAQRRLSGGDFDDERIGGARSRNDIAAFVAGARFVPTGETLRQIQDRVLPGVADGVRVPLYTSTAGWITANLQAGWSLNEQWSLVGGVSNLFDRNYRIHGSGTDAPGANAFLGLRAIF
ncbi:MAG: TonB-dependent receptor, partial [Bryobacteraceae bacterium]|nr:TonB-dependent receptor [Bryobacteraceae bacterium]